MGKLFGTDGIRGKANRVPMDSETVLALGRALAFVMRRNEGRHRVLIGKDTRVSGYLLETALASGICSMGVDVLLVGPLPTPGVAFMVRSMRADAGVMISASHNPYDDNGIKIFGPDGFKLDDLLEQEIESLVASDSLTAKLVEGEAIGKAFRIDDAVGRYTVYLKSCIERNFKLDGLKLVVDSANGACYKVAPLVFGELGAEVISIGDRPDGLNINKGCGSLHPECLARLTVEHGADCGIALDGDGDRLICCDEKGQIVDGDHLLALCAFYFAERKMLRGTSVVGTAMSNLGLEKALNERGIGLIRAAVGDRYVLQQMLEHNCNIGGEQSGHVIALDYNTTGDGILTALLTLSILQRSKKPLSEHRSLISKFPQVLINIPVAKKIPFEELPAVSKTLLEVEHDLAGRGRVLLRYSGTEFKARVMVEADDEALCQKSAEKIADCIKSELA